jgi:putative transposase
MEEVESELSVRRRCQLLGINRSTVYYEAAPTRVDDVDLLNAIRDVWERYPFYGYRRIHKELKAQGMLANRKRVQRLMVLGGIQAIHPGPNTSRRNQLHTVHPYLLRDLTITRSNQAWMVDITYLRMPQGFMYLVALIDVYSRYVVGWSMSNTLETAFCVDALKRGLLRAIPDIINSDQGCQFTSEEWVHFLRARSIRISMTGKGRCTDNIYIERFWRSLKREEFYLNEYADVKDLKKAIHAYIEFYNHRRWHQSLAYKTPAEVYFGRIEEKKPVDSWTSPSDQPAPFGVCGQALDNASALPTACPHSLASRPQNHRHNTNCIN